MIYLGIYSFVIIIFILLRAISFNRIRSKAKKALLLIPVRTYIWHIIGSLCVFGLMSLIVYLDVSIGIESYMPNWLFVILVSIVSGVSAYILIVYMFSRPGIYENGVLTHFTFIPFGNIDGYELTFDNNLNINKNIKTLKFRIKEKRYRDPSFEYLKKDEIKIVTTLSMIPISEIRSQEG